MDKLKKVLRDNIKKYKEEKVLNTSSLRKHKIHDVGHDTIRKIMTVPNYSPGKKTIIKLLEGFEVDFVETFSGIKLTAND